MATKKTLKVYEYNKCSTCRKALSYLDKKNISYNKIPIVDTPPSQSELKKMLAYLSKRGGSLKNLFNTSGELYRELKMSEKIKNGLSEEAALKLLSTNGKLVKRPFVLSDSNGTVGFDEKLWKEIF